MWVEVAQRIRSWLDSVADRLGITPWAFGVGAVAVVMAGIGGWWALRAPPPPRAEEVLPRISTVSAAGGAPAVAPEAEAGAGPGGPVVIVVHVDGAVARPGVHELAPGSRVVDAIDAAQGLRSDADRSRLNLAAPVGDGQRVWVPVVGEDEPPVVAVTGGSGRPGSGENAEVVGGTVPLDLNSAGVEELETLPGVGPSIAAAIARHREDNGPFARVEDLLEVPGIGPARLARLEALVAV